MSSEKEHGWGEQGTYQLGDDDRALAHGRGSAHHGPRTSFARDGDAAERQSEAPAPDPTTSPAANDKDLDFEVKWDGLDDPGNPKGRNFASLPRKWAIVLIGSSASMCVTSASAMYTSIYEQVEPEFHANRIQLTAGLSLSVWKLGFEPLIFSPLSEFYGRKHILRVFSGTVHDLARTLRSGQKHCHVARVTFLRRSGRQRLPHRSRWNGGRPFSCGQAKLADDYIHSQPLC
jgi:hypothetical protein